MDALYRLSYNGMKKVSRLENVDHYTIYLKNSSQSGENRVVLCPEHTVSDERVDYRAIPYERFF